MAKIVHAASSGLTVTRAVAAGLLGITAACSAGSQASAPAAPEARAEDQAPAPTAPADARTEPAAAEPAGGGMTPSSTPPQEAAADGTCPADMKLVSGDYCTDVEQTCLKSWYDKSNKKTVCEQFAEPARCVGSKVPKRFCIDTYEYPNVKGERPEVMNRFHQAQI